MYFSIIDRKNINLIHVHQVKCSSGEVYSLLNALLLFGES